MKRNVDLLAHHLQQKAFTREMPTELDCCFVGLRDMSHFLFVRMTQEERDLALARQLQAEEQERRNRIRREEQRRNRSSESSCKVS